MSKVLVTGGSGFLAAHCLVKLLSDGHEARATLRDMTRQDEVRAMLQRGGASGFDNRLSFYQADLLRDENWAEAVAGCDYVLHVASPFPSGAPKDETDLITAARDGSIRVLRAARDAGVKRVVLTSSFAAIGYAAKEKSRLFTEADWTDPNAPGLPPYQKSKTLAERAAWQFLAQEGGELELTVVNPVGVVGPVLGPDYSTSIRLIKRMLDGDTPGCPDLRFGLVDARDVADLHVTAMTHPSARGERFLATAGDFQTVQQIACALKSAPNNTGHNVSTRRLPSWLLRLVAPFNAEVRGMAPELGKRKNARAEKAHRLLGWTPRSPIEAVRATAQTLLELGLLRA